MESEEASQGSPTAALTDIDLRKRSGSDSLLMATREASPPLYGAEEDDGVRPTGKLEDSDGVDGDAETRTKRRCSFLPGPPQVKNIIMNELCERFNYYGLRAILVLYLHRELKYSEDTSNAIYSYFSSGAYFSALLGGYISDSYWGKYKTILNFSLAYLIGSILLSATALGPYAWGAFGGLALIGIGTGGIKPVVAAFGADQFPPSATEEIARYWLFFYLSINCGSLGSYIFTPLAKKYVGYWFGFGLASIMLVISIVLFWTARHRYINVPPSGSVFTQLTSVYGTACRRKRRGGLPERVSDPPSWLDYARGPHSDRAVDDAKIMLELTWVFVPILTFWALFDQQGSTWTLQLDKMKLYGLEPEQFGVLNPLLIVGLAPLLGRYMFPCLNRILPDRLSLTPLRKIGLGMLFSAASFVLVALVQVRVNANPRGTVSAVWVLPQYTLITIGEVCISITCLEFAYTQAPASMKSVVMALFYMTIAIGDLLAGVMFTALGPRMTRVNLFLTFAALMLVNLFIYIPIAMRYSARRSPTPLAADDHLESPPVTTSGSGVPLVGESTRLV